MDFYFVFKGANLLVATAEDSWQPLRGLQLQKESEKYLIGTHGDHQCWATNVNALSPEHQYQSVGLRELFGLWPDELIAKAHLASQVATWSRQHKHCGQCGDLTSSLVEEWAKVCDSCQLSFYPRISPAVIVLITKGEQLLLAKNKRFKKGFYSALAGFVDPGESLEQTIHREIKEEVGIEIKNLQYFGSQPWPFPHSLMIGFLAEHANGDIVVDDEEIADAQWFNKDQLPTVPPPYSIARKMIDSVIQGGSH